MNEEKLIFFVIFGKYISENSDCTGFITSVKAKHLQKINKIN